MFTRKLIRAGLLGYCLLIINIGNTQNEVARIEINKTITVPPSNSGQLYFTSDSLLNSNAIRFVNAYLKKNKFGLPLLKKRSKSSFAIINSIFSKNDIPVELKYLAVIESGLKPGLINSCGAAGIWQIMPVTADELGLTITENSDDRLHIYKSTKAITKYLKQLHEQYGDWLLVIAAYNSGPGYVNRAIRLSGSHDFWKLQNWLPAETRNHVKKFISIQYYFEGEDFKLLQKKADEAQYSKS